MANVKWTQKTFVLKDAVESTIDAFLLVGKTFTKYDVTTEVRKMAGRHVNVKHDDVKLLVEDYLAGKGDIVRSQHPSGAIQYSLKQSTFSKLSTILKGCDPGKVSVQWGPVLNNKNEVKDELWSVQHMTVPLKGVPATLPRVYVVNRDKRGSITVPRELVKKFSKGVDFKATKGNNQSILKPVHRIMQVERGVYMPYRGSLRITQASLPASPTGQYYITLSDDKQSIVISGTPPVLNLKGN